MLAATYMLVIQQMRTTGVQESKVESTRGSTGRKEPVSSAYEQSTVASKLQPARRRLATDWQVTWRLRPWLCSNMIDLSLRRSGAGWSIHLSATRVVPWDADILMYCEAGNMNAVRKSFDAGLASPFDCDPGGSTMIRVGTRKILHTIEADRA